MAASSILRDMGGVSEPEITDLSSRKGETGFCHVTESHSGPRFFSRCEGNKTRMNSTWTVAADTHLPTYLPSHGARRRPRIFRRPRLSRVRIRRLGLADVWLLTYVCMHVCMYACMYVRLRYQDYMPEPKGGKPAPRERRPQQIGTFFFFVLRTYLCIRSPKTGAPESESKSQSASSSSEHDAEAWAYIHACVRASTHWWREISHPPPRLVRFKIGSA